MGQMRNINSAKFKEELDKRKLNKASVSQGLGFGNNYITDAIRRGRISNNAVRMLEVFYGISPDTYSVKEDLQVVEPVAEEKDSVIDYDRLREVIYDAVYWAVKKAWSE